MSIPIQKTLRAAIYTRVSSDEQIKGHGLEYQLEDCRRAIEQHGHQLTELYSDPGISGTVENRPALNRLRQDAKSGKFDIVYFWKSDRLARDEIIQLTLYREFKRFGIETYSVSEPTMNDLMRGIYAVFGAEDLRNIKAKMYSGRIQALRAGKWIGPTPYGYAKDAAFKLVINPPEAKCVKRLFEWFVDETLSLKTLAKRAYGYRIPSRYDNRNQPKPRNGPGFWSQSALGRLLKREYYATGEATITVRPGLAQGSARADSTTEQIRVTIPTIISRDLFIRAQDQLRRNHQYARRRAKRLYLFAKKLRCGACGLKLTGSCRPDREGDKFYRGDRFVRDSRCQRCRYYREHDLDAVLWRHIVTVFQKPEAILPDLEAYRVRGSGLTEIGDEKERLARDEAKIASQEKTLLRLQLEGFYGTDILAEKKRELVVGRTEIAERKTTLERRLFAAEHRLVTVATATRFYESIRDQLEVPTYALKERVYQLLLDKVVLNDDSADVWLNIPDQLPSSLHLDQASEPSGQRLIPNDSSMDHDANKPDKRLRRRSCVDCEVNDGDNCKAEADRGMRPSQSPWPTSGLIVFAVPLQVTRRLKVAA